MGGTSCGAPTFAAIALLLNHYLVSNGAQSTAGLGNMNPRLYSLAAANPAVFHDVTSGNNLVSTCSGGRRSICTAAAPEGFSAGPGYDQVTGLGSVDAYNLVASWLGTIVRVGSTQSLTAVNLARWKRSSRTCATGHALCFALPDSPSPR